MTMQARGIAPEPPLTRLHLGVTGHRATHPGVDAQEASIAAVLAQIFDIVDRALATAPLIAGAGPLAPTRLHALLADGADSIAADIALARGYELVAPLPFGRRLNKAINALPVDASDARLLLAGEEASDPLSQSRADAIRRLSDRARLLSLANQDETFAGLFLDKLDHSGDQVKVQRFAAEASRRVATAGRILIGPEALISAAEGDRDKKSRQLEDLVQSFLAPHKATPGWLR